MGRVNSISYLVPVSCSIGVIGFGQIAQALIMPMLDRGDYLPDQILGVVASPDSVPPLLKKFPRGVTIVSKDDPIAAQVWDAPIKILSVKPQQIDMVAKKYRHLNHAENTSKSLLISLLAGIPLKQIKDIFPSFSCVRAVTNTPLLVGFGLTGLALGEELSADQRLLVQNTFESISEVIELPEHYLDSFLALTSSGPAYIALIAEALADGAVAAGLPRKLANKLTTSTLLGTAKLLKDKELHPAQLKEMVTSPAGTTISGLRCLEKAAVRSAFIEAVAAAAERSRELG